MKHSKLILNFISHLIISLMNVFLQDPNSIICTLKLLSGKDHKTILSKDTTLCNIATEVCNRSAWIGNNYVTRLYRCTVPCGIFYS